MTNDQETISTAELHIPRLNILTGHNDPDSAYLVDDYPYGRSLRCQIRYWIDTRPSGKNKGDQRFARQTTNPKRPGTVWNKPHYSTYSGFAFLYLDGNGHVQWVGIPTMWIDETCNTRARHSGLYDALTDEQRKQYDARLAITRKYNPTTTAEWNERVTLIADYIRATGAYPVLTNNVWTHANGQLYYLSDPAAYVVAARERIQAEDNAKAEDAAK